MGKKSLGANLRAEKQRNKFKTGYQCEP